MTIREACEKWVDGFNCIPQSLIEKTAVTSDTIGGKATDNAAEPLG